MLLLAGNCITFFHENFYKYKKIILVAVTIFLGSIILLVSYSMSRSNILIFINQFFSTNLFERNVAGDRYNHIAFQGTIQIVLILSFLILIWKNSKIISYAFMLLIGIDSILAVQLNIGNVCVGNTNPLELDKYLQTLPKDFPCPADEPLSNYNEERGQKYGLFRNTAIFHRWVSDSYHNSFVFNGKTFLQFEKNKFYQALLQNRLFYLSNDLLPWSQLDNHLNDVDLNNKVFMDKKSLEMLRSKIFISLAPVNGKVTLNKVNPNILEANVNCISPSMLHCLQSFYPGWKAYIDNHETEIFKSNELNMSIVVPKGTHHITFEYKNKLALWSGITAYTVFILLFIYISIINFKHSFYRYLFIIFWIVGLLAILKYFYF
jgi:hypothetical protein